MKVNIDLGTIQGAAIAAFNETCFLLHREMIQVISEPGAFEGFEGDIVDTGNLRANQQPPEIDGTTATFRNTAEYALAVHEGADYKAGKSWQVGAHQRNITQAFGQEIEPRSITVRAHEVTRQNARKTVGRPWMRKAIERLDVEATFGRLLENKLR